jgi:hypothetical protein
VIKSSHLSSDLASDENTGTPLKAQTYELWTQKKRCKLKAEETYLIK